MTFLNRVTSKINNWLGRTSNMDIIQSRLGEVYLTHDEAIRLSAVWACVSVISKALASSEWNHLKEKPNHDKEAQYNSTGYYLLNKRPNPEITPFSFHEASIAKALLWGDSYAEIERDIVQRPSWLWPLEPERCQGLEYTPAGDYVLRVKNYGRDDTLLLYSDVYHIHGLGLDGRCGLDLVGTAARSFLQALAAERFALKFYQRGGSMGGVLSTDQHLDQAKIDAQKKSVKERVAGVDNAFEFLLLAGGWKFQSLTQDFDKAQLIESRYFLIEETCRWFGVPPHKIAHLLRATFSNIEHEGISFQRDGLKPWAVRCQQEVAYKILPTGPHSCQVDLDWTSAGDAKSQAETSAILVRNGLRKRNELRRRDGFSSLGAEGEILTVESALTTLTNVMNAPPPTANGATVPANPAKEVREPKNEAAYSMFENLFGRVVRRQILRARDAAAKSKDVEDFERRMDATEFSHRRYIANEIREVTAMLADFGVDVAGVPDGFINSMCDEERVTLRIAFEGKALDGAIPADRAKALAKGATE